MVTTPPAPREPDPELWLTPARLQRLEQQLAAAAPLLGLSGLLKQVLAYWVRLEIADELVQSGAWPEPERQAELEELEQAWLAAKDRDQFGLSEAQLRQKLLVAPAGRRWARQQWQQRLETLYLERKDRLDRASCRLLRLSNKYLALELYHRLRSGEQSFERLALEFGEGPERFQGGLLPLQPLAKLPFGLAPLLKTLRPGELMPPQRFGQGFAIVQLECFEPVPLDQASEEVLLQQELNAWIQQLIAPLQAHLISTLSPSAQAS
jgi:parvulin-like peptidyl-prolyl isomerase